jgi:hypothetical protein
MGVATAVVVGGVIAAGVSTAVAVDANNKAGDARTAQRALDAEIKDQENALQKISNPYANATNPYASLGVATQASEFQAQEADVALANTLDTIMSTGGGAGGATALAQMALKSKQGIAADLQKQEANIQKLRVDGEATLQKQKIEGEKWRFGQQENRDMTKLDRTQAELDNARQMEADMNAAKYQALGNVANAATSISGVAGG